MHSASVDAAQTIHLGVSFMGLSTSVRLLRVNTIYDSLQHQAKLHQVQ